MPLTEENNFNKDDLIKIYFNKDIYDEYIDKCKNLQNSINNDKNIKIIDIPKFSI